MEGLSNVSDCYSMYKKKCLLQHTQPFRGVACYGPDTAHALILTTILGGSVTSSVSIVYESEVKRELK